MSEPQAAIPRTLAVGQVLRGRSLAFTLGRVLAFSGGALGEPGWPHRNLHTDRDKAREAGLTDIIVSGTQFEGLLLSHLVALFGEAWSRGGRLEAKIVKSAYVNDVITPVVVVTAIEGSGADRVVQLEAWCETQAGDKVLVGSAAVGGSRAV